MKAILMHGPEYGDSGTAKSFAFCLNPVRRRCHLTVISPSPSLVIVSANKIKLNKCDLNSIKLDR